MYRYQVLIEYDGKDYVGWQKQKNGKSIQSQIQNCISKILKEKIKLYGSGRTDSGVHAINQSAHFDTKETIINLFKFLSSLNHFLNPKKITIKKINKKKPSFHSRYSAKEREYKYIILNRNAPSVLENYKVWHLKKKLDLNSMKKGAKKLVGTHNFNAFRSSNCDAESPIKTIKKISIIKKNEKIIFTFRSKSFLKNQVRSMVGCLKYLGEKKWKDRDLDKVLNSKSRKFCAPPAPAHGLFLSKVIY
jgi:tRNA pseudouridine38-40 synthase|tara:strand:- start:1467 stop:2207 length:741 start_codon:yes stop_codon:yes gene_type:complete